jgi:hypothetical protein
VLAVTRQCQRQAHPHHCVEQRARVAPGHRHLSSAKPAMHAGPSLGGGQEVRPPGAQATRGP